MLKCPPKLERELKFRRGVHCLILPHAPGCSSWWREVPGTQTAACDVFALWLEVVQGRRMPSQPRRRASRTINLLWLTVRICMGLQVYRWTRKVAPNFFLSISHLVWTWASSEPPCATAPDQKGLQRTLKRWGWQILGQVLRITGFGGIFLSVLTQQITKAWTQQEQVKLQKKYVQ